MLETRRSVMGNLYGGIEAGGTWFVCAVGTGPGDLSAETRFPTTTPQETIRQAIDFFREQANINRNWHWLLWPDRH